MWQKGNRHAQALAKRLGKIAIGGSDSHAMRGVGLTYTEVPGAKTVVEFFAGLRAKRGKVPGRTEGFAGLRTAVFPSTKECFKSRPPPLALFRFPPLFPWFPAAHWMIKILFFLS